MANKEASGLSDVYVKTSGSPRSALSRKFQEVYLGRH